MRVIDAGLLNMLQGQVLSSLPRDRFVLAIYLEPQMLETVIDLVLRVRLLNPDARIIAYGPACITYPRDVEGVGFDAFGVRGDYELQIRDAIQSDLAESAHLRIKAENGWRDPVGEPTWLSPAEWGFPNLSEMPVGDLSRIYQMKNTPLTMAVTAARGCPFSCAFCSTPSVEGRRDRRRPIAPLIEFLDSHQEVKHWQLYAPSFTLNRQWCMEFCRELSAVGFASSWRCTTRADLLDEELIDAMQRAGCEGVGIGVETVGSATGHIDKRLALESVTEAVGALTRRGMVTKCYVMLGLPDQTLKDVHDTLDLVRKLGAIPRLTLYSPQGAADLLIARGIVEPVTPSSTLDRKAFIREGQSDYAELLKLLYHS